MIPYDAEKLLLFLEEEEFIVNKVKKMLYSQKVAPYVFVIPFVISLLVFWLYPLISGIVMFSVGWSEALSETGFR